MTKMTDFLKRPAKETRALIQGSVPEALRLEVAKQMKRDKDSGVTVTWNTFLEAACRAYLNERK